MDFLPGGRFHCSDIPIFAVLATAYNLPWQSVDTLRIKGLPDWMLAEKYDIEATAGKGALATNSGATTRNERIRLMLQSLFADRFKLKAHLELTEVLVYALTVSAHGPSMEKAKISEQDCAQSAPSGGIACHQFQGGMGRGVRGDAVDMSDLALYVSNWSDRPLVDQTGLRGLYAVRTEGWSAGGDGPAQRTLAEILKPLGLKLVSKKAPVEVLVIEHVERPSEN
jgi:uncharacterized protein (TIGR03435 family)